MGNLILVNKENTLSKDYLPANLVKDPRTGVSITKEVCKAFYNMNKEIKKLGTPGLVLVSGYRSYDYQQKVFSRKVKTLMKEGLSEKEAAAEASRVVALPGSSEHQTGLAIDLTSESMSHLKDPLIEEFADTLEGQWLKANSYKFGFIKRYPKGFEKLTGIVYEPWHYRYVGVQVAEAINASNICLEQYIKDLKIVDKEL